MIFPLSKYICELVFLKNDLQDQRLIADEPMLSLPQQSSVIYHLLYLHTTCIFVSNDFCNDPYLLVLEDRWVPEIFGETPVIIYPMGH